MRMLVWKMKEVVRRILPQPLIDAYHFSMALFGAALYGFPSQKLIVIGVTGTKGKSSTAELVNTIFEQAGYKTALLNSIRFKIADDSQANLRRMTTPGRFFIQDFLARAVRAQCAAAIIELTSEGARQYRHRGLSLDALIFTNLAPEHIESHGSLEAYADAKYEIGKQLGRSHKRPRIMVANADDGQSSRYLTLPVESALPFSLSACAPFSAGKDGGYFTFDGTKIAIKLPGEFSLMNALAAATVAGAFNIRTPVIAKALNTIDRIPGRAERVEAGQRFDVVVDYAHTPDSLTAIYEAYGNVRKICVLGATGGGRDLWKRPVMGGIAENRCDTVILTNEDPYDEDPRSIVEDIARGMKRQPLIIMDRREAIAHACAFAREGDAVLITGKGTDPCICGPRGSKLPWGDAQVAREEIGKLLAKKTL